jgi:hypothetical protein
VVAVLTQQMGKMAFTRVKAPAVGRLDEAHQPVALRVTTGHHRAAARRADRAGREAVGEAALGVSGQMIHMPNRQK